MWYDNAPWLNYGPPRAGSRSGSESLTRDDATPPSPAAGPSSPEQESGDVASNDRAPIALAEFSGPEDIPWNDDPSTRRGGADRDGWWCT